MSGYCPAPLLPDVMRPLERTVSATAWPAGHSLPGPRCLGRQLHRAAGLPTYTVGGVAVDRDDVRAHGRDERVAVAAFTKGNEFFYHYVVALTPQ